MSFQPGDSVDLFDRLFQQWRGAYVVTASKVATDLVRIKNCQTNSVQFVRADRLRKGRLAPFFIKSLKL